MLSYLQALLLGALQGITELFPISSLGHSVLIPGLLHWQLNEQDPLFLTFLVATHFATAIVLVLFYWQDWKRIVGALLHSIAHRDITTPDAKIGWLLIVSSIPAGILGVLFQQQIQAIFITPRSAAFFLMLNGLLLLLAEWLRRRKKNAITIAQLSWTQGLLIGAMQALALIPGFSRTGASLSGGLVSGLSNEDALHFSFLLATPLIAAAALLELPSLFGLPAMILLIFLLGAVAAGVCAYLAARFLTRYFKLQKHTLLPFALYCLLAGALASIYLF